MNEKYTSANLELEPLLRNREKSMTNKINEIR